MSLGQRRLNIFVSYARKDRNRVRLLVDKLRSDGFYPWWDHDQLYSSDDWKSEIRSAINAADAVVCCLTQTALKNTGFFRKEIQFALRKAHDLPQGARFFFPVQLKPCKRIPAWLCNVHCESLFDSRGYSKLRHMLQTRAVELERISDSIPAYVIEGTYTAIGNNSGGESYSHQVQIDRTGHQYKLTWDLGDDEVVTGSGTIQETFLAVTSPEWAFAYDIHADGSLSGEWERGAFEKLIFNPTPRKK